jgi:cephalosporin-C deacetylase-like acetyl esterase
LARGCADSAFSNSAELNEKGNYHETEIMQHTVRYFKSSDLHEMMDLNKNKIGVFGGGFGVKASVDIGIMNKKIETVNAITAVLTDYRKHYYWTVSPSSLKMDDREVEMFVEDP